MKKIAVYSDQPILVAGFRNVVSDMEGFTLAAVYPSLDFLATGVGAEFPDVLLIDVRPATTLDTLSRIKSAAPRTELILWAESLAPEFAAQAVQLGVRGFLPRSASLELHMECIRQVARGELWIESELSRTLLSAKRMKLTRREQQLMLVLAQGLKNKEIAWKLGISQGTVKVYLSRLFQKVGASDRFELALIALRNLTPDQTHGSEKTGFTLAPGTGMIMSGLIRMENAAQVH